MKKRIFTFLLALSVLFMISCDWKGLPFWKEANTEPQETTAPNKQQVYISWEDCTTPQHFRNYLARGFFKSYRSYILDCVDLESIGTFEYFDYSRSKQYRYDFSLSDEKTYSLTVSNFYGDFNYSSDWKNQVPVVEEHPDSEMRTCQNSLTGYYYLTDDLRYYYLEGLLYRVEWIRDSVEFSIWRYEDADPWDIQKPNVDISELPNDEDSLVSRLLNKETAVEAKAEFDAMLAKLG